MRKQRAASFLFAAALILGAAAPASAGWFGSGVKGSGDLATEERDVDNFDAIRSSGSFDVEVTIGQQPALEITFDDNLLDQVKTEVKNGTLHIYSKESFNSRKGCDIKITIPGLTSVKVSGSGDFKIFGLAGDEFEYEVSGSGDLEASGTVEVVRIEVSGSGDVDARDLKAKRAYVDIAGSGDVEVWADEVFDGHIAGSGDIAFYGNPDKISRHIAGSGDIRRRR